MIIPTPEELFSLEHTIAKDIFKDCNYPFEALPKIKELCISLSKNLGDGYTEIAPGVFAANDAKISESATIIGPAIIGHNTEVRPGAYIRGSVIIGDGAVIGNSTEIKNAIIFDGAQLPHYNYVGDSIIGYKAHMGAGAIISNFRLDHNNISIKDGKDKLDTGLRKMGVLLGDRSEVGCNSVICPGSIIGRDCVIYPLSRIVGILPSEYYFYGDERAPSKKGEKGI
jgi:NDP-sugar pyrophosphorylase family protein